MVETNDATITREGADHFAYERPERQTLGNKYLETADKLLRTHGTLPDGTKPKKPLTGHIVTPQAIWYLFDAEIPIRCAGDYGAGGDQTADLLVKASIELLAEGEEPKPSWIVNRDMSDITSFKADTKGLGMGYSLRGGIQLLDSMLQKFDKQQ